jgi:hypothetical protein
MEQAAFDQCDLAALLRAEPVSTSTVSTLPGPSSQISVAEYLSSRLDDQIDWYSTKSTYCQTRHKVLRILEVIAAAMIPFLSAIGTDIPYNSWIVGSLGAVIAICAASSGIFKFHENWIQFRATENSTWTQTIKSQQGASGVA